MPRFQYRAVDSEGRSVEDTVEGESARQVITRLADQGLQVNSVEEVAGPLGLPRLKARLSWEDLDVFNQQLLAITRSGLPLAPSLRALAQDLKSRQLRGVLNSVREAVEGGVGLDEALGRHPASFSPVYRSVVRAGERAGNLSGVLGYLAHYSSRMIELRHRLHEAAAYPLFVVMVAASVIVALLVKVVPVFAATFQDFGGELPMLTEFWVAVAYSLRDRPVLWIEIVFGLPLAGVILVKLLRRSPEGRALVDRLRLSVPIVGSYFAASSMARFTRTLGLLLASRVPIGESMELAGEASGNAVLRDAAFEAIQKIEGGERISDALASTGRFSHSFCWMLANAEERGGSLYEALLSLADSYDKAVMRLDRLIRIFAAPAFLLTAGIVIFLIIVSLYLPVFSLADALSGAV